MSKQEQAKENMNLFLMVLQQTMKTTGIALGWDLENKKLVLQDVSTQLITRIELTDLNSNLFQQED